MGTGMGTKLLACLCTVDSQGTHTSAACLDPMSKEPVCFCLVSLSRAVCERVYRVVVVVVCACVFFSCSLPLFRPSHSMSHVTVAVGGGLGAERMTSLT